MKSIADRTHDISVINYHVKDLQSFGERITEAAAAAFPNSLGNEDTRYRRAKCRYKQVHVLLLSWEADDLGVAKEIAELQDVFHNIYHYEVEHWKIPSSRSHNALNRRLTNFIDDYEGQDSLLIVYYGGHGYMNDDRQCIWSCNQALDAPEVQWYGLQTNIEQADCDVLILLDCCASASSSNTGTGSGVTELIAACGFETVAPGVGEHSFTRSLIDELKWWTYGPSLTAAMLHNKVLSRVKYWKPRFGAAPYDERRRTPMYIVLANEGKKRSIEIVPLPPRIVPITEPPVSLRASVASTSSSSSGQHPTLSDDASSSPSNTSTEPTALEDNAISSESSISQVWPDRDFKSPKVLISVALEEDQWLEAEAWADWLEKVPAKVKYANVEGIYKSDSTIVLLSIAVAVWDLIASDPAVKFLGFVRSPNLLQYNARVPKSSKPPDWCLTTAKDSDPENPLLGLSVSIPAACYISQPDEQLSGLEKAVLSEVVMSLIRLRYQPQSKAWPRFSEQPPEYTETSHPPLQALDIPPSSSAIDLDEDTLDTRQMDDGIIEEAGKKLKELADTSNVQSSEPLSDRNHGAGLLGHPKTEWKPELYQLAAYTTIFIVDDSTFEHDLWGETRAALVQCTKRLVAVPNVDLRFRISLLGSDQHMNVSTHHDISQTVEPQGPTHTYKCIIDHWGRLKKALAVLDLEVRNDHPGLNIIVFLGRPLPEDFEILESLVTDISISLDLLMVDENKVGLQFVQIGSLESVTRFIKRLLDIRARYGFRRDIIDATIFNPDEDTYSEILLGAVNEDMKAARAAMRYHIARYESPELVLDYDLDSLLGLFPNTISTINPTSVAKSHQRRTRARQEEILLQQMEDSTLRTTLGILYGWDDDHGLLSDPGYYSATG